MARKLTDLSQLSKAMFRSQPTEPAPASPTATPTGNAAHGRDEADVLAFFSKGMGPSSTIRPTPKASPQNVTVPAAEFAALKSRIAELEGLLAQSEKAHVQSAEEAARAEQGQRTAESALRAAQDTIRQLRATCAQLEDSLRQASTPSASETATRTEAPAVEEPPAPPRTVLLKIPPDFSEVFPGELREMILSALAEMRDTALQAGRDRRTTVLEAFLAANPPSGELGRRRARLRQILKNAGPFNDAHVLAELAELGIRPVSGRKHWKLDYGGLRLTMAKTPSDFRSSRNAATEIGNRCY